MPNPFGIPEITPQEVAQKRANHADMILLDVREARELQIANLGEGVLHVPLSQIAEERLDAFPDGFGEDKAANIIVFCHHGSRSAQVAAFLQQQGWENVLNLAGGIDAYAIAVDPTINRY